MKGENKYTGRSTFDYMPALSINQPWGWLIATGHKKIENRDWKTNFRGRFYIHVGLKTEDDFDYLHWEEIIKAQVPLCPFRGGVIGEATLVDCVSESDDPFFMGKYGFVLKDAVQYHNPRPCKGALGFFKPDWDSRYVVKAPKPPKEKAEKPAKIIVPDTQIKLFEA